MGPTAARALLLTAVLLAYTSLIAARTPPDYAPPRALRAARQAADTTAARAAPRTRTLVVLPPRTATPTATPSPSPTPTATPTPTPFIAGAGPVMPGQLVAQTERLDFYIGAGTLSAAQIAGLAPLAEQALRASEARLGTALQRRVTLAFYRPGFAPSRGLRGLAYTDSACTELFYHAEEDPARAVTVVAHELAHHLQAARYGDEDQRLADTVLLEGHATWVTGAPWLALYGAPSWRDAARHLRDDGVPLRLLTAEESGPNSAYTLWASFVDFLLERYGQPAFDELYRSGRGRAPGSADYAGVLGLPLEDLADEWRAWLDEG